MHENKHPVETQKSDIQMQTFLTWDFKINNYALFLSEQNQNLLDIQEHCTQKLGKIQSELNFWLVFITDF